MSALFLHPGVLLLVALIVAAAACFGLGTMRGSWRVWLVGYVLFAAALGVAYGAQRSARRNPVVPPAPTPAAHTPATVGKPVTEAQP